MKFTRSGLATLIVLCALMLVACQQPAASAAQTQPSASASAQAADALDQPAEVTPPRSAAQLLSTQLDEVLAGAWRTVGHKARDQYRHPRQTLAFFGVEADQHLIEISPGGGWYAELLAPLLNDHGHYVAAIAQSAKPDSEAAHAAQNLQRLMAAHPAQFGNASVIRFDPKTPVFGKPGSADRVLTFRNVHNWVMGGYAPQMFKGFFAVLKTGGVLGVTDHRAAPDAKLAAVKSSGYLPQAYVIKLATDAGFKLAAKSEINANPKDDRDHPKGVWTLPPTLALGVKDRAKYIAIGESDRMSLRFVKPAADEIKRVGMDSPTAK